MMKPHATLRCSGWGILLFLTMLITSFPIPNVTADDALDVYNFAVGAYRQERWRQAEEAFGKFVMQHPKHPKIPTARLYRGLALTNLRDYKAARPVWRDYVKDYPQNKNLPVAMYRVAECSYLLNDLKAAETEFQAFLKKFPQNDLAEWALPFLGETQLYLKKPADAVKTYKLAEVRFPKGRLTNDVQFGLARAYEALKQTDDAIKIYETLAKEANNSQADQAQLNLAALYFEGQDFTKAADAYIAVEENFPKSDLVPTAQLNAGYAWYQVGDYRKAISQFDKAAGEKSQTLLATYWKGISHKSLGEYAEASKIFENAGQSEDAGALRDNLLYQWADCDFRSRNYEAARDRFLQLVREWPKSEFVEDSLHLAGESALFFARQAETDAERLEQLDKAEQIIESFPVQFPNSPLLMHHEMLKGRLLYVQGGTERYQEAEKHLRTVLEKSRVPKTRMMARFHLGRTLQKLQKHKDVVEVMTPVIEDVKTAGVASEFLSGLVIIGLSELALKKEADAVGHLTSYLDMAPKGEEADLALAARALAHARLKDKARTKQDLLTLRDQYPTSPLLPERAYQIAEMAYDQNDWTWSAELFQLVVKLGTDTNYYRPALSGLAWTEYQNGDYLAAAGDFSQLAAKSGNSPEQQAEASYMQGRALEAGEDLKSAANAYQKTFETFAPKDPAAAKAETKSPLKFAFLAGVQAARVQSTLKQHDLADVSYEAVLTKFPEPADLDKLLDEWALMNLQAERFKRSDEIFEMLIAKTPKSPLVDNARLSLAESDFVEGEILKAKKVFQDLATNPKADQQVQERASYQFVEILTEQRDWAGVRDATKTFLDRNSKSQYVPVMKFRQAEALTLLEEFAKAELILAELKSQSDQPAIAQSAWFPRVWVLLAECQVRQKDYADVEATVAAFRQWDPKNARLYEAEEILGRCFKNQTRWDEARAAFERALGFPNAKGTETAAKSQLMIAETYFLQMDWKNAQENYLKVYYNHKGFPEWQAPALFQAGKCDEQLGDKKQAAKTYKELITRFRTSKFKDQAQERWAQLQKELQNMP